MVHRPKPVARFTEAVSCVARLLMRGPAHVLLALILAVAVASPAAGQVLPWQATFDGGTFGEFNGGFRNETGVVITDSSCQSGRCARAPLVAGTNSDNYGDLHFGDHTSIRQAKVEEVWLRFWGKFDAGYAWPNRSQKLAILNLTDGQTTTRHYQVYVYVRPNGDYAVDRSNLDTWQFWGLFQNVGSPVQVQFGQWEKIKLYVRLNSPGAANGLSLIHI